MTIKKIFEVFLWLLFYIIFKFFVFKNYEFGFIDFVLFCSFVGAIYQLVKE
jgi:hypothetical protein